MLIAYCFVTVCVHGFRSEVVTGFEIFVMLEGFMAGKLLETIKHIQWFSTAKWFWHSGTMMMVMIMNDGVDDEIEDTGNHFHSKMGLEYNSQKPFPQQNGFGIPVR